MGAGDDARGGAGQRGADGQALRGLHGHDAAVRLHDLHLAGEAAGLELLLQSLEIACHHRLQIGVEGGGGGALELADLRQDLARRIDIGVGPDRAQGLERAALVLGIGVGVDEDDADRLAPSVSSCFAAASTRLGIDQQCGWSRRQGCARPLPGAGRAAPPARTAPRAPGGGRSRRRISSTSRNPPVVMRPVGAPLRSSSALVPTVVPCTIGGDAAEIAHLLADAIEEALRLVARVRRHLGDGEAAGGLRRERRQSVKVPPTSTPTIAVAWRRSCARLTAQARGLGAIHFFVGAERPVIARAASRVA